MDVTSVLTNKARSDGFIRVSNQPSVRMCLGRTKLPRQRLYKISYTWCKKLKYIDNEVCTNTRIYDKLLIGNKLYDANSRLMESELIDHNTKTKMYMILIRPVPLSEMRH